MSRKRYGLFVSALCIASATTISAHASALRAGTEARPTRARNHVIRRRAPQAIDRQITLAGHVTRPDGSPAGGAVLYANWLNNGNSPAYEHWTADSSGRFQRTFKVHLFNAAPVIRITALEPGKQIVMRTLHLTDKTLGRLSLRLQPGATLTGRILEPNGHPLSGIAIGLAGGFGTPSNRNTKDRAEAALFFSSPLPREALAKLFTSRTDSVGRFTLRGLLEGQARLKLPDGWILATGSTSPTLLDSVGKANVGLLVAVWPGSLTVHVTDRMTGKSASALSMTLLPKSLQEFTALATGGGNDDSSTSPFREMKTDAKGAARAANLVPGEYRVLAQGLERTVTIVDGQRTNLDLKVRTGPLKGRIFDANGKPAVGAPVTLEVTPDPRTEFFGGLISEGSSGGLRPAANADRNGEFEIADFPWESESITLRTAHVNDAAEWTGTGSQIGHTLELHMKSGALLTVMGRLVDPQHKPLPKSQATLIRWQNTPRITWFLNANQAEVGADGRFHVDGLPRGEAFSLLSGSGLTGGRDDANAFESPRFTTETAEAVQDLGDVVVHPLDGSQQVLQIYGIESREQLAQLASLRPLPTSNNVEEARRALARYRSALESGDVDTIYGLTSRVSAGWSEDRREFLIHSTLRSQDTMSALKPENVQPIRFVPNISLAYLLLLSKGQFSPFSLNFGTAARELEANPDWLILAGRSGRDVRVAGFLHREDGRWKVVNPPDIPGGGLDSILLIQSPFGKSPDPAGFARSASPPDPEAREAARSVGERFLQAWSRGDDATLIGLTSPLSSLQAANLDGLRRLKTLRLDEGVCPVHAAGDLQLKPIDDLTVWEQEWLANYAQTLSDITGTTQRGDTAARKDKEYPNGYVTRGNLISFRYSSDGHDFMMLLLKRNGRWQVLEPAISL